MIKFFRKIRQRLLTENKFSKYFLYAIGEIALIVIGVLIALQINNWNESRIRDKSVRSHLNSLTESIEHDIREYSISMEFSEFQFHSWQYLLKMSNLDYDSLRDIPRPEKYILNLWDKPFPDVIRKEFIDLSMGQLNNAFLGMQFNYSAINEIHNLGIMSDINNDTLKTKINNYYYHLDWKFGEQLVNRRYRLAENLRIYLRDKHEISCNYPPDPKRIFEVIRKDEQVVIMMKDLIKTVNDHYWETRDLQKLGRQLVEMINKEFNLE